jgi:hypothetical protein
LSDSAKIRTKCFDLENQLICFGQYRATWPTLVVDCLCIGFPCTRNFFV